MAHTPRIIWTDDIDIEWHLDNGELVIDHWNVGGEPVAPDRETYRAIWPDWMLDAATQCADWGKRYDPKES